jgi:hypothetical protein
MSWKVYRSPYNIISSSRTLHIIIRVRERGEGEASKPLWLCVSHPLLHLRGRAPRGFSSFISCLQEGSTEEEAAIGNRARKVVES